MTDTPDGSHISTTTDQIYVVVGGPQEAEAYSNRLADLFESDLVPLSLQGSSFFSRERYLRNLLDDYVALPHFKVVTAWNGGELVGFVYGSSLPSGSQWWKDVKELLPEGFTEENGNRTLALFDIVVKNSFRGQGIGSQLHTKLLQGRSEERVTLLSEPELQPAYMIWQHWGYQKIGTAEPAKDGTVLDVFIRPLE